MVRTLRNSGPVIAQIAACFALCFAAVIAQAQTFQVLHTFTGSPGDGAHPFDGVIIDQRGDLYGTAYGGGINANGCYNGCGTMFKLAKQGSGWLYSTIYKFHGPPDGNYPAGTVIGPDGSLYGATYGGGIVNAIDNNGNIYGVTVGGGAYGYGVIWEITP